MKRIYFILFGFLFFALSSLQGQKYSDLPEDYQEVVSRKDWRQAERQAEASEGDFGLSPIDRIYYDEEPVNKGRGIGLLSVESWGREYILPPSIRSRVINECGNYPFIVGTVDSGTDENHIELRGGGIGCQGRTTLDRKVNIGTEHTFQELFTKWYLKLSRRIIPGW